MTDPLLRDSTTVGPYLLEVREFHHQRFDVDYTLEIFKDGVKVGGTSRYARLDWAVEGSAAMARHYRKELGIRQP